MSAVFLRIIAITSIIYSQFGGYVFPDNCIECHKPQALQSVPPHVLGFIIPPVDSLRPLKSSFRLVCMEYELFYHFRPQFDIKMYYKKPELGSKNCSPTYKEGDIRNKNKTNYRFGWTFRETWLCNKDDIGIEILYECGVHDENIAENGTWIRENTSSIKYELNFVKLNASLIKNCIKIAECECPLQCTHASLCGTLRLIEVPKKDASRGKSYFQWFVLLIIFLLFIGLCVIYFNKRNSAAIYPFNS